MYDPLAREVAAHLAADPVVLGHPFGDDVRGSGQRVVGSRHLGRDEPLRLSPDVGRVLRHEQVGQRLQPPLAGGCGAGPPAGLVGQVEVLDLGGVPARLDPCTEFAGQPTLFFDRGEDRPLAGLEFGEPFQQVADGADGHLVERAGDLLAVAADEGDCGPLAQQADGAFDLRQGNLESL